MALGKKKNQAVGSKLSWVNKCWYDQPTRRWQFAREGIDGVYSLERERGVCRLPLVSMLSR